MVRHNVDRVNDVRVLERAAHTKLGSDLFLVLLFRLALPSRPKLLDGVDRTSVLCAGLDKTDCSACTRAKDLAPFAVLFRQVSVGSL